MYFFTEQNLSSSKVHIQIKYFVKTLFEFLPYGCTKFCLGTSGNIQDDLGIKIKEHIRTIRTDAGK